MFVSICNSTKMKWQDWTEKELSNGKNDVTHLKISTAGHFNPFIFNWKLQNGLSNPPLGVQTTEYYKMIISVSETTNSTDALT